MDKLPQEILHEIFHYITCPRDTTTARVCRLVSILWKRIIESADGAIEALDMVEFDVQCHNSEFYHALTSARACGQYTTLCVRSDSFSIYSLDLNMAVISTVPFLVRARNPFAPDRYRIDLKGASALGGGFSEKKVDVSKRVGGSLWTSSWTTTEWKSIYFPASLEDLLDDFSMHFSWEKTRVAVRPRWRHDLSVLAGSGSTEVRFWVQQHELEGNLTETLLVAAARFKGNPIERPHLRLLQYRMVNGWYMTAVEPPRALEDVPAYYVDVSSSALTKVLRALQGTSDVEMVIEHGLPLAMYRVDAPNTTFLLSTCTE